MRDFTYRKKTVEFYDISGEVLDNSVRSESKVWSTGGHGVINQNGGYITPTQIHSSSVNKQDIWLQTKDGEKCVRLGDSDIPIRVGQSISIICARLKRSESAIYATMVNHSAGKYWQITSGRELNRLMELELYSGMSVFKGLLLLIATGFGFSVHWVFGIIPIIILLVLIGRKQRRGFALQDNIIKHTDEIAKGLLVTSRDQANTTKI